MHVGACYNFHLHTIKIRLREVNVFLKVTQLRIVRGQINLWIIRSRMQRIQEKAIDLRVAGIVQVHHIIWVSGGLGCWEKATGGQLTMQ